MTNLNVKKIDDEVISKLRLRAIQHGISIEEEVRRIITFAASSPDQLGDMSLGILVPVLVLI